jgi:hypothetical protein
MAMQTALKERSKNNLRKFIAGLEKRWDSIDQLSQIVFETFLRQSRYDISGTSAALCLAVAVRAGWRCRA